MSVHVLLESNRVMASEAPRPNAPGEAAGAERAAAVALLKQGGQTGKVNACAPVSFSRQSRQQRLETSRDYRKIGPQSPYRAQTGPTNPPREITFAHKSKASSNSH
jgi:hypothetical protein